MIFLTLELISQLQWVIAGILLGDSFSGHEKQDLWNALCSGDMDEVRSIQADIAYQWEQARLNDLNDYRYQY
jgi:hypothetical protein